MIRRSVHVRSWLPIALVAILLGLQVFSPARAILFTMVALGAVLLISYLWARQLAGGVTVQRMRRYGWAQVGDVIQERWIMHNDAWVPVLWAEIQEFSDLVGYDARRAIGLGARSQHQWMTQGTCRMRGVFTLGPLLVSMGDPFGFFEVQLSHADTETFIVYPAVVGLPDVLREQGVERGTGRAWVRSQAFTTNAASTRPYVPGDAVKRIHWRATAKRSMPWQDELQVKEFDREPSGDLWIVLDMQRDAHTGRGIESTVEYAVAFAASLAGQMLRSNRAVGLITHTGTPLVIPPAKGHDHLWALLRALAPVYATSDMPLRDLLQMAAPALTRNMTVAVITPSADAAWIEALGSLLTRGIIPTAVLVDGASFGSGPSLAGVQGALADVGVPAHMVQRGYGPISDVFHRPEPEFTVTGTGRAVRRGPREAGDWVPVGVREANPR